MNRSQNDSKHTTGAKRVAFEAFSKRELMELRSRFIEEDGIGPDEVERLVAWAWNAQVDATLLEAVQCGDISITWPEGSDRPLFRRIR